MLMRILSVRMVWVMRRLKICLLMVAKKALMSLERMA